MNTNIITMGVVIIFNIMGSSIGLFTNKTTPDTIDKHPDIIYDAINSQIFVGFFTLITSSHYFLLYYNITNCQEKLL